MGTEASETLGRLNPMSAVAQQTQAIRVILSGHVQGVGFRPFVFRLASEHGVTGQVQNRIGDVEIVACGDRRALEKFCTDVVERAPPLSNVTATRQQWLHDTSFDEFSIVASTAAASPQVCVPPDYFMCDDCRNELRDAQDRRYQYPFINCTQCGPRYTLIQSLPYDRPNTSMSEFVLCDECLAEYRDPLDRRFHAEPVACAACGPALTFHSQGESTQDNPFRNAVDMLRAGKVVAVKGIGGYHLLCDAFSTGAVATLRNRKHRPCKPFAVLFPVSGDDDLQCVRQHAHLDTLTSAAVTGPMRPIVLLRKKRGSRLAANVAPGLAEIGAFLPYSPLHQMLLDAFGNPVIATSGNISGEPVITENEDAKRRLAPLADCFLQHNRPIVRPADDSVFRRIAGQMRPLRIGRGAAPLEIELPWPQKKPTLAVGGQMKGTIALSWNKRLVMSPHIGEMDSPRSMTVFEQLVEDLQALYKVSVERIVCDAHPGYTTHRWSRKHDNLATTTVWHHHAHASAVAAEFQLREPAVIFTWDGVGLGEDGDLWGGEAFLGRAGEWRRVASFRRFRLPGGDLAGREPWRSAAALMWECDRAWPACPDDDGLANAAWRADLNSPGSSAVGRLFDAAAALVQGTHKVSFEAAGPMQLEALCRGQHTPIGLPMSQSVDGVWRSDWEPLLDVLQDERVDPRQRAEILHSSLAYALQAQARVIRDESGVHHIGLCGGVFQNRVLTEQVIEMLRADGFAVYLPKRLPCNDAALCVGQAAEVAARENNGTN